MAEFIKTTYQGQRYENQISDAQFDERGTLIFFTMHFNAGPKHLYLNKQHSVQQIANDIFRGALTARSVKGLLNDLHSEAGKAGWAIGSAVALADFLNKNHFFKGQGYYDAQGKLQVDEVLTENNIIYR